MTVKVKIFSRVRLLRELEENINSWIYENLYRFEVIDIKFSLGDSLSTAMIIYKEIKEQNNESK